MQLFCEKVTFFLLIYLLVVHEFPDPVHPGITSRARRCVALETVAPLGQGMEVGLDTHSS